LLHFCLVLTACALFGVSYIVRPTMIHADLRTVLVVNSISSFAAIGALTGLAVMAGRSGKSESVVIAISTVASFLLFVLSQSVRLV
jgi:hypothetical protein